MNINNKILLSIIVFSLAMSTIGAIGFLTYNSSLDTLLIIGATLFLFSGIYFIFKNGTFINTQEFRYTRISISFLLIGTMFKIMHWPYASALFGLGCLSIPGIYLYYMYNYKRTSWTNYIKLLFIFSITTSKFFTITHFPYSQELIYFGLSLLIVLIVDLIKKISYK